MARLLGTEYIVRHGSGTSHRTMGYAEIHAGLIERVLVNDIGKVVLICCEDEYAKAQREDREPLTGGSTRRLLK